MTTRLALTLAGGVSLGAYQAGAVYEVLWALSHRRDAAESVIIDVLTGASAGSMTAAVTARVLYDDAARVDELHRAWVRDISFMRLIEGEPEASLLSSRSIWSLAREVIERAPAVPSPHPASPPLLRMAFALSNLNGVRFQLGYANAPDGFDTTIFSDWIVFQARPGARSGGAPDWQAVARAAVASGAFPFAFAPVRLERRLADYRRSEIYRDAGTRTFTYVDGGMFNNEPVGLAREMVGQLEVEDPAIIGDRRYYVLIDPYVAPAAPEVDLPDPLGARLVLDRLVSAVLGESSKRDWIRALRTNSRLEWQDGLIAALAEVVAAIPSSDGAAIAGRLGVVAAKIGAVKGEYDHAGVLAQPEAARRHLEANIGRLGPMLSAGSTALDRIRDDPAKTDLFLTLAYVLENVAGLRKKVEMKLHLIAPAHGSLAGDFLGNFGGFFDERWREHDWRRGRADARVVIEQLTKECPSLAYVPAAEAAYVPAGDFSHVGPGDIPADAPPILRRRLADQLYRLILPGRAWFLTRWLAWLGSRVAAGFLVGSLRKPAA